MAANAASYLQRSRTAPVDLQKSINVRPALPRALSQDNIASKSKIATPSDNGARIWAERRHGTAGDERADPHSVSPGGYWSGPSDEEWSWMKEQARPEDGENGDELTDDSNVEEVIRREDKFGVLSVGALFKYLSADDHLISPYADEDAIDEDSLYLHLRHQRTKLPRYNTQPPPETTTGRFSQLFLVN